MDLTTINSLDNTKIKTLEIGNIDNLTKIIKNILESKIVLRAQQIKTLENVPNYVILRATEKSNIIIKETLVKVMHLLKGIDIDFPLLKTPTDILRFVVSGYSKEPIEGQINKTILKSTRIKIPTSIRKMLLNNLEMIGKHNSSKGDLFGSRYLTEDMYSCRF